MVIHVLLFDNCVEGIFRSLGALVPAAHNCGEDNEGGIGSYGV
jgi:hypothetical protein